MNKLTIIPFVFFLGGVGSIIFLILKAIISNSECDKQCQDKFADSCSKCSRGPSREELEAAITIFCICFLGFVISGYCIYYYRKHNNSRRETKVELSETNTESLDSSFILSRFTV
ncbi:hypothetical protein C2G38_2126696 [Gigaspora rosea]|uniref:Uncharacterized protein n=1 Tax=Gigaspora rosea TaxID=44941 RepID=A0A397TUK7_9GLOM|nr:hypothetical protein C2G38_2126696 [Gigaspora rosea]